MIHRSCNSILISSEIKYHHLKYCLQKAHFKYFSKMYFTAKLVIQCFKNKMFYIFFFFFFHRAPWNKQGKIFLSWKILYLFYTIFDTLFIEYQKDLTYSGSLSEPRFSACPVKSIWLHNCFNQLSHLYHSRRNKWTLGQESL